MGTGAKPVDAEPAGPKQRGRPFAPGQSGNPAGRRAGSRNTALVALDAIGTAGAEEALRAVVEAATAGDIRAAEILLSRVWPVRKGRPVMLDLPRVTAPEHIVAALADIMDAVASGAVTPDEAAALAGLIDGQRKAIETLELERRVAALEESK